MLQPTQQDSNQMSSSADFSQAEDQTQSIWDDVEKLERLAQGRTTRRSKEDQDRRSQEIKDFCDRHKLSGTEFDSYSLAILAGSKESVFFSLRRKAEDFAIDVANAS